jgi:hypothetical protein
MFRPTKKYPFRDTVLLNSCSRSRDTVPLNSCSGERAIRSPAGAGEIPPHLPAHGAEPAAHLTAQRCKYKSPDILDIFT